MNQKTYGASLVRLTIYPLGSFTAQWVHYSPDSTQAAAARGEGLIFDEVPRSEGEQTRP